MTAPLVLDLDDADSLAAADSVGALRSAALGGAQVRATAAAVTEGALARLDGLRPRSVVLVTGAGRASRASALLVAALGGRSGLPVLSVPETPPWVGPLDVVVVAGDDSGDPRLVESVDRAVRRGAEVVLAAPEEGPLRSAGAGRASALPPRVSVLDINALVRYLAVSVAVLDAVDTVRSRPLVPDLDLLADVLDAEALRDHPGNEVFHNPAKSLATRMHKRRTVLAGDSPATTELARHGSEVLLRGGATVTAAAGLGDVLAVGARLDAATATPAAGYDPFFHDEELDGPAPVDQARIFVLSTDGDRLALQRRVAALPSADTVTADSIPTDGADDLPPSLDMTRFDGSTPARRGVEIEQLATVAVRLEMTAAYLQLMGGR
ncbi:tobH protein [Antrihabitans cavernicola]|uniref:TobH protein n=1 Tax=Antrihabitans cavernicola TaxID=2495913 RepID=A0A5A7SH33_9NOCA|nr:tobH protein [Spelaeibacter cavernicola]KAA0023973.1 tobH protein [Spelaeibacter cavernicola]